MFVKTKKSTVSAATKKVTKLATAMAGIAAPAPMPAAPVAAVTPEVKSMAAPIVPAPLSTPIETAVPVAKKVTPAERWKMIEFEAYLLAEKNNFKGHSADYWTQAERFVNGEFALKILANSTIFL